MSKKLIAAAVGLLLAYVLILAACTLGEAEAPPKNIIRPYISVQPKSASFYTSGSDSLAWNPSSPHVLSVSVNEWNGEDGSLSYEWYTFKDIEEFCKNDGKGTLITGATGSSYTPTLDPKDGDQYFYYVIVTNTNDNALAETTASIQSDVAVISFSSPGKPLVPVLTRSPSSARYPWGATLNSLQVRATAPDNEVRGVQLSYQWYSNGKNFSVNEARMIPQANQNIFLPDLDDLEMGDNVFFVRVTNELGEKASATSIPARITLEPGKRAAVPRILTQPRDKLYFFKRHG